MLNYSLPSASAGKSLQPTALPHLYHDNKFTNINYGLALVNCIVSSLPCVKGGGPTNVGGGIVL